MEDLSGFNFQSLQFDFHGAPLSGLDELAQHVKDTKVTDVILICHGFRNDENAARNLYGNFLKTFADNSTNPAVAKQLASRKFAIGGVFWPSMIFQESFDTQGTALSIDVPPDDGRRLLDMKDGLNDAGQQHIDDMVALLSAADADESTQLQMSSLLLSLAQTLPVEADNEFRSAFANATPDALRNSLLVGDSLQVVSAGAGAGGVMGIPDITMQTATSGRAQSFIGNVLGFVPKFLNLTTFLLMFYRCGDIGSQGISQAVRRITSLREGVRVHLVGHSLGGRAITACAKQLVTTAPTSQVDSMMMLEAAYSHFGLSQAGSLGTIPHPRGFFRDVIEKNAVKGPILATYSERDSVVGFAYTSMAAVSLNNSKAFGDENSPFGGIGHNGVLDTPEASKQDLHLPGDPYSLTGSKVFNLNGSRKVDGKSLIDSHGDVTNAAVTWAFASLVATT